jgi:hypothetical protein
MSARRLASIALFALAACTGEQGPPGPEGPQGPGGDAGPPGPTPATTGTIDGTVTDGVVNVPLGGVTVTAEDLGGGTLATATTGTDGSFTFTVAAGPVDLVLAKTDYTSPGTISSGVGIGQTIHLAITMNEAASGKPSVALAAPGDDIGYGQTIALTATSSDPDGDALTTTWANATWPTFASGGVDASGNVTTPSMADAFAFRADAKNPGQFIAGYAIQNRIGIVPILPDTRGQVTATVTVTDGKGQSASASWTVNAASVATSAQNLSINQRVYLNSGHTGAAAWSITSMPAGSTAALDDPTSRTPSFVPNVGGPYVLAEGAQTFTLYAGSWRGMVIGGAGDTVTPDTACTTCHGSLPIAPDEFTPWLGTKHATMFTTSINGEQSPYYSAACIGCHTVGNDPGVANANGFDDVAAALGWKFPSTLAPTNWSTMSTTAPQLALLANVQCETCHGPQSSAAHTKTGGPDKANPNLWDDNPFLSPRISYSAEACGTCHGAGAHHTYSEWAQPSGQPTSDDKAGTFSHANRGMLPLGASATGLSASCGRCHTAQGYELYSDLLAQGKVALTSVPAATLAQVTLANAEPVTCVACHDPHDATNPNQLRFYGDTPNLPGGFAGYGMGKGAVCLTCHNSRNGAQTGSDSLTYLHEDGEPYNSGNPTGYSAPHEAAQGDVFEGHNAYFLGASTPMLSKHAAITDTCVGCHMTLQPDGYSSHGTPARSGHLFRITDAGMGALCSNCHGSGTVDGAGIQDQTEALLAQLNAKMGAAVTAKINGNTTGGVVVRAHNDATDLYSSASGSTVALDLVNNPVTSASAEEVHGQIAFVLSFATPMSITFTDGSTVTLTRFSVQMGDIKDATAKTALYALSGNLVRAGWNYFLVEGDQSKGLHNPSFVSAVLSASLHKDLSN